MGKLIDLTGKTFGRLRVIERAGIYRPRNNPHSTEPLWKCLCDPQIGGCGTELTVLGNNLRSGKTRSCGCLRDEKAREQLQKMKREGKP